MKKQSDLSRLMGYAGYYRYFTYASRVLSAVSAPVMLAFLTIKSDLSMASGVYVC